jgi:hypothetical protein
MRHLTAIGIGMGCAAVLVAFLFMFQSLPELGWGFAFVGLFWCIGWSVIRTVRILHGDER